jgi:hypothetical protein
VDPSRALQSVEFTTEIGTQSVLVLFGLTGIANVQEEPAPPAPEPEPAPALAVTPSFTG